MGPPGLLCEEEEEALGWARPGRGDGGVAGGCSSLDSYLAVSWVIAYLTAASQ